MTIGEKFKDLIQQSGMTPEEVASLFNHYNNTEWLEHITPVFNVDVTYYFTKTAKNKTAVGSQSIAGSENVIGGNFYVSAPPEGYIKIMSADGLLNRLRRGVWSVQIY